MYRLPTRYASIQKNDYSKDYPMILTSGRLVEYEGGGDESRSNPWLAELQQDMFVEINPSDANDLGIRTARWFGSKAAEKAQSQGYGHGYRTGRQEALPLCRSISAGHFQGKDLRR